MERSADIVSGRGSEKRSLEAGAPHATKEGPSSRPIPGTLMSLGSVPEDDDLGPSPRLSDAGRGPRWDGPDADPPRSRLRLVECLVLSLM